MGTKLQEAAAKKAAGSGQAPKGGGQKKGATAVAVKAANEVVALPGIDLEADAGMGLEGADKDSFALPFLAVLQGLSPQLKTVEDARPGKIINTVTNEVFDMIEFVPVAFQRRYNRWLPRSAGGGYKGSMSVAEVEALIAKGEAKEVKQLVDGKERTQLMYDGTQLKDTRNHFVLLLDGDGGWSPALISLASTQIKRSKRLLSVINGYQKTGANGRKYTPPSFASFFTATSESESNAEGEWESWVFERGGDIKDADLYNAAKEFHAQVTAGQVVVAPPIDEEAVAGQGEGGHTGKTF